MEEDKWSRKKCNYCGKNDETYPIKSWNKDEVKYYCIKHYKDVAQREIDERDRFINYYSLESRRKLLSPSTLKLWKELKGMK